jgi:hypothetical protein
MSVGFIAPWRQRWGCVIVGGQVPADRVNLQSGVMMGDSGRDDWRIKLATMVGTAAGAAVALLWHPDLGSFWLALLAFMALLVAGALLGRFAGSFLFRQASGSSPRT